MYVLEVKHIHKQFQHIQVLSDISFSLKEGIYGLIGANGAGKSTLFRILTTSVSADSGTILCMGKSIHTHQEWYRSQIGYMPQTQKGYDHFSALQFLYYMAALKGLKKHEVKQQIQTLATYLHLEHKLHLKLHTFSGGMKQRLMFMQALLGNPKIVLLDEPTAGLDPYERIVMRNLIFEIAKHKTVILATHVMQDIEYIADEVLLLKDGNLLCQSSSIQILEQLKGYVHEEYIHPTQLSSFQKEHKVVRMVKTKQGIRIRYISKHPFTPSIEAALEDVYIHYMVTI